MVIIELNYRCSPIISFNPFSLLNLAGFGWVIVCADHRHAEEGILHDFIFSFHSLWIFQV